jgi:hypothetical protein
MISHGILANVRILFESGHPTSQIQGPLLADFARNENSSFQTLDVNALAGQNMRE